MKNKELLQFKTSFIDVIEKLLVQNHTIKQGMYNVMKDAGINTGYNSQNNNLNSNYFMGSSLLLSNK